MNLEDMSDIKTVKWDREQDVVKIIGLERRIALEPTQVKGVCCNCGKTFPLEEAYITDIKQENMEKYISRDTKPSLLQDEKEDKLIWDDSWDKICCSNSCKVTQLL